MTHYDTELTKLKESLLAMASRAESAVTRAMRALVERNGRKGKQPSDHAPVFVDLEEAG